MNFPFLFTGNNFLYFTVTLKENKHFKILEMVVLLMLKYSYGLIFAVSILQTWAEGVISVT